MSDSPMISSVRRLRSLLADPQNQEQSDEQLLAAFADRRDDVAFAALVRRHGPMVLGVCRRVLGHVQDAEDAYQATFLVLARRAAALRNKSALTSFLHGTAFHLASKIKRAAGRRRKYEGQAPARSSANPADELLWREVQSLLDEEIARLPETYRSVFVLCCLENMSQAEAARRLGRKERTVSNHLAEARKRLARRLARRGLELSALLAATTLFSGQPSLLMAKTVEMAVADSVVPASLAELVEVATAAMTVSKARISAVVLLLVATSGSLVAWYGRASGPLTATPEPPAAKADDKPKIAPLPHQSAKTVAIHGRVLDPEGKPAPGASVSVDPLTSDEKPIATTTTGKDGRFSLLLPRSRLVDPETKFPLQRVRLLATAKGYGLDWQEVPLDESGKELMLRLVKDDVPILGRILSLEGKPLAGIKVYVKVIEAFPRNDLDRGLDAYRKGNNIFESTEVLFLWYRHQLPNPFLMATTGADGRFRLEGIGRERIVTLNVEGPGIHYSSMSAMTRRAAAVRGSYRGGMIYGATFEYAVKPSRLIRGTVWEKGTGKPLAGIGIYVQGFTAEAKTDEKGRYELPGCPKGGKFKLTAYPLQDAPYFRSSITLHDAPGQGPLIADLELTRGIPCEGKVLDGETGQAVPGEISYSPLHPNPNVPEDLGVGRISVIPISTAAVRADGTFRCVVLAGCGCLAFRAKEPNRYQQACVDPRNVEESGDKMFKDSGDKKWLYPRKGAGDDGLLLQEQHQAIRLIKPSKDTLKISETLRLAVARQVHGTVLDADGKPLTGVRLRGLEQWRFWETLPGEKFTVYGINPRRPRNLYFLHDARRLIGSAEVKGTETKPLTVRMQPWAAVRGRLLDKEGRPLSNASLIGSEFMIENGRTDDQGRFRLDGLIPGLRYDLFFTKNKQSLSGWARIGFIGKPGEVRDLGDVRVKPDRQE